MLKLLLLLLIAVSVGFAVYRLKQEPMAKGPLPERQPWTAKTGDGPSLDQQIEEFAAAGLTLNPGITRADIVYSFPEEEFVANPYELLLFIYGIDVEREPWDRRFCDKVWNFDAECIDGKGSYIPIVQSLAALTGQQDLLADVSDDVDLSAPTATVKYVLAGQPKDIEVHIQDDWADETFVQALAKQIEGEINDGRRFWAADNGQAAILTFLNDEQASMLNRRSSGMLQHYVRSA